MLRSSVGYEEPGKRNSGRKLTDMKSRKITEQGTKDGKIHVRKGIQFEYVIQSTSDLLRTKFNQFIEFASADTSLIYIFRVYFLLYLQS